MNIDTYLCSLQSQRELAASVNDQERFVKVTAAEGQVVKVRSGALRVVAVSSTNVSTPLSPTPSDNPAAAYHHSHRHCPVSTQCCVSVSSVSDVSVMCLCSFVRRFYPTKDIKCFSWHLIETSSDRTGVLVV